MSQEVKATKQWIFGQLTKYNMKSIVLEISYINRGEETSSRPFYKNQNLTYLWINSLILCLTRGLPKYIKTKGLVTCFDIM